MILLISSIFMMSRKRNIKNILFTAGIFLFSTLMLMAQTNEFGSVHSLPYTLVNISDPFWTPRQVMNADDAIFYQWDQLEKAGSIDNFRIVAGMKKGFRKGFFYSDSDVHKWAEAAAEIYTHHPVEKLGKLLNEYIVLVKSAQDSDGYIFTYNQFHFKGQRWVNLMIEHELYTLGHFIEAGVAHYLSTGSEDLLELVRKSADLVVKDFMNKPPEMACGHEEIEIAMLKLFHVTLDSSFLKMAGQFIERRGRIRHFAAKIIRQAKSQAKRSKTINKQLSLYNGDDSGKSGFDFSENLQKKEPAFIKIRSAASFLSGKYFQQHVPVRMMKSPVGHSVRWTYFAAAATHYSILADDETLLSTMENAWENMVMKKMYVTGGIGSLPMIEGFGKDYELDNEFSYSETCAAIGSIFWNHELLQATRNAAYADLTEWQLYNAASVGIALDGKSYLYRNPLESYGTLVRRPWFATSCCPSNISRLWAIIGKYIYMHDKSCIWVNQYIGNKSLLFLNANDTVELSMSSGFPWQGNAELTINLKKTVEFTLYIRIPSWSGKPRIEVNGAWVDAQEKVQSGIFTASGYNPWDSYYIPIKKEWNDGDHIKLFFPMDVKFFHADSRVKGDKGKLALTRGPLVYCLESIDNSSVDLQNVKLHAVKKTSVVYNPSLLKGVNKIEGEDANGTKLVFIPYYSWANRQRSDMKVWVEETP